MSLLLPAPDLAALHVARRVEPLLGFYWALLGRVERRTATPGLVTPGGAATSWARSAAGLLAEAALVRRIHYKAPAPLHAWLRSATLSVIRRPADAAPSAGDATASDAADTDLASLAWGLSVVLDFAADLFPEPEREELRAALREQGLVACARRLSARPRPGATSCRLLAGLAAAAAVLDDAEGLRAAQAGFTRGQEYFTPSGGHGASLQADDQAALALAHAFEFLSRRDPAWAAALPPLAHHHQIVRSAAALLHVKPSPGREVRPRPCSANFGASPALFRASADLLMHVAARAVETDAPAAGLARWLFDTLHEPGYEPFADDPAPFGPNRHFGLLTLLLLPRAAAPLAPRAAGLALAHRFPSGDAFLRDAWPEDGGRTVLAVRGAPDPAHARVAATDHGDLNSAILVHNRERLLVDPGDSGPHQLMRRLDVLSDSHNTLTFETADNSILRQNTATSGTSSPAPGPAARPLLLARRDDVSVCASDAAASYGAPVQEFSRFWILCGTHVVFVVDRIASAAPLRATWHWLLNNRDDALQLKMLPPDRLVARRGLAGMKLFHLGGGALRPVLQAHLHDTGPEGGGDGRPGSALLVTWCEPAPTAGPRVIAHALCLDHAGSIAEWHLHGNAHHTELTRGGDSPHWRLELAPDGARFVLSETVSRRAYAIAADAAGGWTLSPLP
jgi:hypothetical protein